jgi:hypothetical protein
MWWFSTDREEYEDLEVTEELQEADQLQDEELNELFEQALLCVMMILFGLSIVLAIFVLFVKLAV